MHVVNETKDVSGREKHDSKRGPDIYPTTENETLTPSSRAGDESMLR
jgi:hypothetical protein